MRHRSAALAAILNLTALVAASSLVQLVGVAQAQTLKPIQEPITGREELGDLSQPRQALAQFYKAFNSRDLAMIDDNFAVSDEVAIDNPLGGIRRGADVPHKMYEIVFKSPADVHVEFWDYTIHRVGDVFWAVGRERGTYHDGDAVERPEHPHNAGISPSRRPLATSPPSRINRGRKASCGLSERCAFAQRRGRNVVVNAKVKWWT